jgi:quercetin dioxygenase-like cupin family protein
MARSSEEVSTLRLMLMAAPLALIVLVAEGQQGRGGFESLFTGDIEVLDSAEMSSSRIRFAAGARTNWHTHSARQLLLIEQGQGRVQEMGGPVRVLREGETFYTQAGLAHWHGADPDQAAVQFSVYSGTLDWERPVSDDEYLGR